MRGMVNYLTLFVSALLLASCFNGNGDDDQDSTSGAVDFQVETVSTGLAHPWGMAFLSGEAGDQALLTERPGRLLLVDLSDGEVVEIEGLPAVAAVGQGGLLDVALYPNYGPGKEWVYLTYAAENPAGGRYATHVGRGRLDIEARELVDFQVLHVATPFSTATGHFGSRMVFDEEWRLYVTVGDRRDRHAAQDLGSHWGKTLRLERDGSIPSDNPFLADGEALDAVFTYGHRNAQGMVVQTSTGRVWLNEHGQMDGDEINIIDQAGENYGWPVATHSREYGSGQPIGDLPEERDDIVNPIYYWDGSRYDDDQSGFPPSGMAFYEGDAFPQWAGHLFMGNLADRYLGRFELQGDAVIEEERMLQDRNWRIRDVRVHPDTGHLYLLVDASDAPLVRLRPAE